jgi:hypothetical protein
MIFFMTSTYTLRAIPGESDGGSTRCRRAVPAAHNAASMSALGFLPGRRDIIYW